MKFTLSIFFIVSSYLFLSQITARESHNLNSFIVKTDSIQYNTGKKLFNRNCAVCHGFKDKMIGPSLHHIVSKYEKNWIYNYISDDYTFSKTDSLAKKIQINNPGFSSAHKFQSEISKKDFEALFYFLEANSR